MPSKKMEVVGCANFLAAFPVISVVRWYGQLNTCKKKKVVGDQPFQMCMAASSVSSETGKPA
jgi:hypothetical protein